MAGYTGIDIGAKSVVMAHRERGRSSRARRFEQTPAGHRALIGELKRLRPKRIVVEATGVYYFDLAVALSEAGLPVAVINPKSFHHFAKLKLNESKTDPVDAALLAEYAECFEPAVWVVPESTSLALREIGRQINRLTGARTQAKNRLHALKAKRATPGLLIKDEQEAIAAFDRRLARLTQAAEAYLAQAPELARQRAHLQAAKGVGAASSLALLAELCVLPAHLAAPQLSRHAGLDVRLWQSGSSVDKPGRLSKAGNAYLRAALYMPALSAVQHDPYARAFYEALQRRGKKKIQALCAVMRKYLTGLWACLKLDQPFDSAKLFSTVHFHNS